MKRILAFLIAAALTAALWLPASAAQLHIPEGETGWRAPAGLLEGPEGALYIADSVRNQILQLKDGALTVLAGHMLPLNVYGKPAGGYLDGAADHALFNGPTGLAAWRDGLVVSDTGNHVLRFIQGGKVRTLAGGGTPGLRNGSGSTAKFSSPMGLATDDQGNLYIADSGNGVIRKMTQKGQITTYADGFENPTGVSWLEGALYVADAGSNRIWEVKNGRAEVIAGAAVLEEGEWTFGFADGPALKATFSQPADVWAAEDCVYIADAGNSAIRVLRGGRVDTLLDSNGGEALWPASPEALVLVGGQLYAADPFAGALYSLDTAAASYIDLPETDAGYQAVRNISGRGLMVGTGGGMFQPQGKLTRAMLATVLQRLEQSLDRDVILQGQASCADLPAGAWYTDACRWALDAGLMEQEGAGLFAPNQPMTQSQCRAILDRYAVRLGAPAVSWEAAGPDGLLTRSQLCILLDAFLQALEG